MEQGTSIQAHATALDLPTENADPDDVAQRDIASSVLVGKLRDYALANTGVVIESTDTPIASLGIDSVEWVTLLCEMERWIGRPIRNDFLDGVLTVADLADKLIRLQQGATAAVESCQTSPEPSVHFYARHVNPYLSAKLSQLKIDRCFVRGQGSYLYDKDGIEYLDFTSQFGALPFGHHPEEIWNALLNLRSDGEPIFCQPSLLESAGTLARRLLDVAPPGLEYVTFANSGAEAIEAALKMAFHATGRKKILATHFGFHGKTLGALSATGKDDYQKHFGLPLPGFEYVDYGDFDAFEAKLRDHGSQFAAFVVEPIQGEGGVMTPPAGYLRKCQELCRQHGILLIVDEVQTGLGRTGELFASLAEGVQPDIMTLAKALGGGIVPVGACLANRSAYREKFAMKHSSTFASNALAARAGLATLDLLARNDYALLADVRANGEYLRTRLEALRKRYPWLITEIRGRGHMLGIRLTRHAAWHSNFLGMAAREGELGQFVASYLLNVARVRLAPTLNRGEVLRIQPPLNATLQQCERAATAIEQAIEVLASGDTGAFYRSILHREQISCQPVQLQLPAVRAPADRPVAASFAFLLHPTDADSYADYDSSLASLDAAERKEFAFSMDGLLDPFVGSTATVESIDSTRVTGDFIFVSHTAEQLRNMPQSESMVVLRAALQIAKDRGANLVGLGAYSSVISAGGLLLSDFGLPLTSGNSYTVVSAIEALEQCVERTGGQLQDLCVAVVGAGGAIGSCVATLLAERVARLVLIGNPMNAAAVGRAKLVGVALRICAHIRQLAEQQHFESGSFADEVLSFPTGTTAAAIVDQMEACGRLVLTSAAQAVSLAHLVVCATSTPRGSLDARVFRRGAIICDISRPRTVTKCTQEQRKEILVIDGGVVALPTKVDIGRYGLEPGQVYACMAETMLLTLEGRFEHCSLGQSLTVMNVQLLQRLGRKHGFKLSHVQSFGRAIDATRWRRCIDSWHPEHATHGR